MALKVSITTPFGETWTDGYVRICKVITSNYRNNSNAIPCIVRLEVFKDKDSRDAKKSSFPYPKEFELTVDEIDSLLSSVYTQLKALDEFTGSIDI